MSCNSRINDFNDCIPCYGYLCPSCNNIEHNKYENKFEIIEPEKTSFNPSKVNCIICNEYLLKDINKPINHCIICNGNLCSNCSEEHLSKNPSHNLISTKFILTEYISNDVENLPNNNICSECNKNLDKTNSKLIFFCIYCINKICCDCVEKHSIEYPEHTIILSKSIGSNNIYSKKGEVNCVCYLCNTSHFEIQNKNFYFCKECNKNLCESCRNKHDEQFYSHIIRNQHSYEDHYNKK